MMMRKFDVVGKAEMQSFHIFQKPFCVCRRRSVINSLSSLMLH